MNRQFLRDFSIGGIEAMRRTISVLLCLLLFFSLSLPVMAQDVIPGWDLSRIRTQAFQGVQIRDESVKTHPKGDPHFAENQKMLRNPQIKKPDRVLNGNADGSYDVLYLPSKKVVAYDPKGNTKAVGFFKTDTYPGQAAQYSYPDGILLQASLFVNPSDVFNFGPDGQLVSYSLNGKNFSAQTHPLPATVAQTSDNLWSKPTPAKRVDQIGNQILQANGIQEHLVFRVDANCPEPNAFSIEDEGVVGVCASLLDYIESDAELAGLLAHELAHIVRKHGSQKEQLFKQVKTQLDAEVSQTLQQESRSRKRWSAAAAIFGGLLGAAANLYSPAGLYSLLSIPGTYGDFRAEDRQMDERQRKVYEAYKQELLNRYEAVYNRDYNQKFELEADRLGLCLLINAGYPPEGMRSILHKVANDSTFPWNSHPPGSARIAALQQYSVAESDQSTCTIK